MACRECGCETSTVVNRIGSLVTVECDSCAKVTVLHINFNLDPRRTEPDTVSVPGRGDTFPL